MAGTLSGAESVRRFHGGLDSNSTPLASHVSTRRSSFCLYTSIHESRLSSSSSLQRNILYRAYQDENMVGAAREAKQRLDDKFRSKRMSGKMSEKKRYNKFKTKMFSLIKQAYDGVLGRVKCIEMKVHRT